METSSQDPQIALGVSISPEKKSKKHFRPLGLDDFPGFLTPTIYLYFSTMMMGFRSDWQPKIHHGSAFPKMSSRPNLKYWLLTWHWVCWTRRVSCRSCANVSCVVTVSLIIPPPAWSVCPCSCSTCAEKTSWASQWRNERLAHKQLKMNDFLYSIKSTPYT